MRSGRGQPCGNLGSVPNRWLGGSVVRWLGSCANPQPETHTSRPENEGLVPKAPIPKYRIILRGAGEYYADCLRSRGVCPQVFLKGCEISKAKPDSVDSNFAVELEKRVSEMYDQCRNWEAK